MEDYESNPMNHPAEQPTGTDDAPRFGRLLVVLMLVVALIVALTFFSEKFYS